jgi:hypothetical protein
MRKDVLIASVQKLVLKQSPTQDSLKLVHPKVIEDEIAKAYRTMLTTFYMNDINLMNAELDFYSKKYTETIQVDSDKFFYVDLPANVIDLKNNLGLRYIKPVGGTINFIRTRENEMENIRKLPIYCCMQDAYYYLDGSKIMFDFPVPEHRMVEQVYIKLLPEFGEFDDSDNISFPAGDIPVMQMILELMGFRQTDNVNDGVR